MKATNNTVAIVYAGDDNVALPMGVSISSLCNTIQLPEGCKLVVYVIDLGILLENKSRIRKCFNTEKGIISFVSISDLSKELDAKISKSEAFKWNIANDKYNWTRFNSTVLSRFFIAHLLYKSHDRVIYLDTDTLIVSDIMPFWNLAMEEDELIAAGHDPISFWRYEFKYVRLSSKTIINLSAHPLLAEIVSSGSYINSGVLILNNLSQWVKQDLQNKLIELVLKHEFYNPDQDALNIFFHQKIKYFNHTWNSDINISLTGKDVLDKKWCKENCNQKPNIIHFAGGFRPWDGNVDRPYSDIWFEQLDASGWGDIKIKKDAAFPSSAVFFHESLKQLARLDESPVRQKLLDNALSIMMVVALFFRDVHYRFFIRKN